MYKLWNKRFSRFLGQTYFQADLLTEKVIHRGAPLLKTGRQGGREGGKDKDRVGKQDRRQKRDRKVEWKEERRNT